ncbi:MAG: hypothetical protein JXR89_06035 [Deltaproteobacteria bacterium]|nr:hypothetical protein [Deltaproteobacteria bacterium]
MLWIFRCWPVLLLSAMFSACAPSAAYQARDTLAGASSAAACEAAATRQERRALAGDSSQMQGDIERIKEAERLFDQKTGIVLSY